MLRRYLVVGVVLPLVLTVVFLALQWVWLPETPDPMAIHWGWDGTADGSGPRWTAPVLTLILTGCLPLAMTSMALAGRPDARGPTYRFLGAFVLGFSVFSAVLMTWTVRMQVGLDVWTQSPSIVPALAVALGVSVLAGVGAWLALPAQAAPTPTVRPVEALRVAPGEQIAWTGTTTMTRGAMVLLVGSAVALTVLTVTAWLTADSITRWALTGTTILIAGLTVTMAVFTVRVDKTGLTVRSIAGIPRFHVPLTQIETVGVTDVNALGEFGGWGVRLVPGRFGIVLRSGEALSVVRTGKRELVVTVDDAAGAAAALEALASR